MKHLRKYIQLSLNSSLQSSLQLSSQSVLKETEVVGKTVKLKGTEYYAKTFSLGWEIFEKRYRSRIGMLFHEGRNGNLRFYAQSDEARKAFASFDYVKDFPFDIMQALRYVYLMRLQSDSDSKIKEDTEGAYGTGQIHLL